jgi:HTH-type transcriptional regulator/antitoxin HigA
MLAENPVALIQQGAPRRIQNDRELEQYSEALFALTTKNKANKAERETIDLLTLLIEDYELRFALPKASPVEVLQYLMEKTGLRQQDLQPQLGSSSNISMILSGKRTLTLNNASALAERFRMDIRAFLPGPTPGSAKSSTSPRSKYPTAPAARRTA